MVLEIRLTTLRLEWSKDHSLSFIRRIMIEETIKNELQVPLEELGYVIVSVKYTRSKKGNILEIIVDKDDDISIEEIVQVSNLISPLLDVNDYIKENYTLDVTSLGAEKPIEISKLDKYIGKYVNIHLTHPYNGENILEGDLKNIDNGVVELEIKVKSKKKSCLIPLETIDRARLAIKF